MATLTIPKRVTQGKELVIISREEYERFLRFRRLAKEKEITESAVEEGLGDLRTGRVTPSFSSIKEFKKYLKKK